MSAGVPPPISGNARPGHPSRARETRATAEVAKAPIGPARSAAEHLSVVPDRAHVGLVGCIGRIGGIRALIEPLTIVSVKTFPDHGALGRRRQPLCGGPVAGGRLVGGWFARWTARRLA